MCSGAQGCPCNHAVCRATAGLLPVTSMHTTSSSTQLKKCLKNWYHVLSTFFYPLVRAPESTLRVCVGFNKERCQEHRAGAGLRGASVNISEVVPEVVPAAAGGWACLFTKHRAPEKQDEGKSCSAHIIWVELGIWRRICVARRQSSRVKCGGAGQVLSDASALP